MRGGQLFRRGAWLIATVAVSGIVLAGDARPPAPASAWRALADDKCVAQCDQESDKCMQGAGKDASKQRECDASYDACLRKCN